MFSIKQQFISSAGKLAKSIFRRIQVDLRKQYFLDDFLVVESDHIPSVKPSIVDDIFDFYNKVKPFYDENIRPELKIDGAWKTIFELNRKNQLRFIETQDKSSYAGLLTNMLRNEMVSAQWSVAYYDKKLLNNKAPIQCAKNLDDFKYLTRNNSNVSHNIDKLDDGPFGGKWGINVDGFILNFLDSYKGVNAFNSAQIINFMCDEDRATYIDLGSGIGSDAIKVEKFTDFPLRSILIDVPMNLTTAYAYVSMNSGKRCVLISNIDEFIEILEADFDESEFLFVPTILVEQIGKLGLSIDLLYNHGSFSEMDFDTIKFYLDNFLNGTVKALFDINSNTSDILSGGHLEVESSSFPIPPAYKLLKRNFSINNYFNHRYIESLYIYKHEERLKFDY